MQFVALLSQPAAPSHEGVQKLKGKWWLIHPYGVLDPVSARLDEEASRVASLFIEIDSWSNQASSIPDTLSRLYPTLRTRSDNIKIASDIIECCIDSIRTMDISKP